MDSRLRGNDGPVRNMGLQDWIPDSAGNDGRSVSLPLWIADQVRNDVGVVAGSYSARRWRFLY